MLTREQRGRAVVFHLAKRAVTSFRNHPVNDEQLGISRAVLLPNEFSLWTRMQNRDQRHSLQVLSRFDVLFSHATRDERAAALLHDVGKCESTLGWCGRVMATLVGPRRPSFRVYLNHEETGLNLLRGVSSERTVAVLVGGNNDACSAALRAADNV
jgi:hypothetical protein